MPRCFYNDLLTIKRLKTFSGNVRNYVATATAEGAIQPLDKQGGEISIGVFGRDFQAFVPEGTPVLKGDKVKDLKNNEYNIIDLVERDFGSFPYIELILRKN